MIELPPGLGERIAALFPGSRIVSVQTLGPDRAGSDETTKEAGYGLPRRIELADPSGQRRHVVFRIQAANDFGHDRRADRAGNTLLAFDDFNDIPCHVKALDVGAIGRGGRLLSLADSGELYLITTWAAGRPYADDLREVATAGRARPLDLERCRALARYLVGLHARRGGRPAVYRRAIRDLVGHGEGIMGIIDGYPPGVPAAPAERLRAIERRCVDWRWRLRGSEGRLTRTHGDFHPFNVVFDKGAELALLDASRGCAGDPADDVTCMAVNYLFFALDRPAAWADGFRPLWRHFWDTYLEGSGDRQLLEHAAPFLAWRGLVLANPAFYPHLAPESRDRLLGFVERVLDAPALDPAWADELF